jgi:hypothetical protein
MTRRVVFPIFLSAALIAVILEARPVSGCACVFRLETPAVNADQSVIILWDAANKTEHFIRKASFQSAGDDFGFIVPSPSQPELEESGNDSEKSPSPSCFCAVGRFVGEALTRASSKHSLSSAQGKAQPLVNARSGFADRPCPAFFPGSARIVLLLGVKSTSPT